jgi:haloacetate dehalogenase
MELRIPGFEYDRVPTGDVTLNVATGGAGTPVVLLHGFPQTHLAWRDVAIDLAADHRVICPDLRGYGASDKPPPDRSGETYSKRRMAQDVVGLMRRLGHDRFGLIGHDRGALVAFRAGIDHPEAVSHVAVIDVIPQADMWATLHGVAGVFAFHLYLLAQPPPLPERLIGADPDAFFGHFLDSWATPSVIPDRIRTAYLDAARPPAAIRAICADYRAGAFVDPAHDEADRAAGRRLAMPVAAMWQDPGDVQLPFDPAAVWRAWAPDLRTHVLPGGHFLPEECPADVTAVLRGLLRDGHRRQRPGGRRDAPPERGMPSSPRSC